MRLHFRNKMFISSRMIRFCFVLSLYYLFTRFPYFFGYNMEFIPDINIRTMLIKIHEVIYLSLFFNVSVGVLATGVLLKVTSSVVSLIYNQIKIVFNSFILNFNSIKNNSVLDASNPFLYSYKTKALLE